MISSVEVMRHCRALRRFPKAFSLDLRQEFGYNEANRSARLDLYGWEWAGSLSKRGGSLLGWQRLRDFCNGWHDKRYEFLASLGGETVSNLLGDKG